MSSEIRTNTLTSRAGLSTVTMTDSGPMFSGITTFVDNSGFTFGVGGGTSIFTPATNILTLGTNNTEKVRIDANGNTNITGVTTAANFKTGVSNLHDVGLTLSGGQIDVGSNIKIGTAGVVTATTFSGSGANLTNLPAANLTGTLPAISGANLTNLPVPTTITVADESSDTTCNPLFVTTTSGNLAPKTGTNLTFNSSSGNLRTGSLFLGTGSNESKTQDGLILERNSGDGEVHISAGRSGGNYSGLQFYVAGASGVTKRFQIDYQSNFRWYAANGLTERAKITNDGYSKFTSDGTYDGYSNASQAHEFRQSLNKPTLWCSNSSSAQTWEIIRAESARGNNSAFGFISCTSGNLTDDEFRVRGDGQVYADGSFNSGGADYAEYFEWTDGNSSYEDRRGMTVVLDGNKVKLSTSSDSTDNIIGVVSGNASVIGDAASEKWTDKYLRDDYGAYLRNENGERVLNSSFDDTKTYVSRENRQEWDAIGMVGKLRIRKGQTTGTRWIKMRDISDTVEEWLVR